MVISCQNRSPTTHWTLWWLALMGIEVGYDLLVFMQLVLCIITCAITTSRGHHRFLKEHEKPSQPLNLREWWKSPLIIIGSNPLGMHEFTYSACSRNAYLFGCVWKFIWCIAKNITRFLNIDIWCLIYLDYFLMYVWLWDKVTISLISF